MASRTQYHVNIFPDLAIEFARHRNDISGPDHSHVCMNIVAQSNDDFDSLEQTLFERVVARELCGDTDF